MILDAIRNRSSFNVIYLPTMDKADIFIAEGNPWSAEEMRRRRPHQIDAEETAAEIYFASPEDTVLQKLRWYRMGGGSSERQWHDVLGVLKVQGAALDREYLQQWAGELRLTGLLNRALEDAGLA